MGTEREEGARDKHRSTQRLQYLALIKKNYMLLCRKLLVIGIKTLSRKGLYL
jgi:hypothetical protein